VKSTEYQTFPVLKLIRDCAIMIVSVLLPHEK